MEGKYIRNFVAGTGGTTANCAVVGSTTTVIKPGAAAAENFMGIAQQTVSAAETVDVVIFGETYAKVGEAITNIGTPLTIHDTAGYLDIADTNNDPVNAIALETASADGDLIKVFVIPNGRFGA